MSKNTSQFHNVNTAYWDLDEDTLNDKEFLAEVDRRIDEILYEEDVRGKEASL